MSSNKRIDPFKLDIFRQYNSCSAAYYHVDDAKNSECLYCNFYCGKNCDQYYFIEESPLTSNWLELFGYGETDWDSIEKCSQPLELLKSAYACIDDGANLLGSGTLNILALEEYLNTNDLESFYTKAGKCLAYLKELQKIAPALCYCYPMFFYAIKGFLEYYDEKKSLNETIDYLKNYLSVLTFSAGSAMKCYDSVRSYAHDVLIAKYDMSNNAPSRKSPIRMSDSYKLFCQKSGSTNDFLSNSSSEPFPNAGASLDSVSDPSQKIEESWEKYDSTEPSAPEAIMIMTLDQYAHIGLLQLILREQCLRRCKLCGKYFRATYTSRQNYCSRIYKDYKTPCKEFARRQRTKKHFLEHPINAEYKKSYTCLYARVMRGKASKDSPLFGQLKELQQEYVRLYDQASEPKRQELLNEYAKKNKELLG